MPLDHVLLRTQATLISRPLSTAQDLHPSNRRLIRDRPPGPGCLHGNRQPGGSYLNRDPFLFRFPIGILSCLHFCPTSSDRFSRNFLSLLGGKLLHARLAAFPSQRDCVGILFPLHVDANLSFAQPKSNFPLADTKRFVYTKRLV